MNNSNKSTFKRRVPPTRYPHAVSTQYYNALKRLFREQQQIYIRVYTNEIRQYIAEYSEEMRMDSYRMDGALDRIQRALEYAKSLVTGVLTQPLVQDIASKFVKGIEKFNKRNMQQQGGVVGIDPTEYEPWLDDFMRATIQANMSYITNIRDEYTVKMEAIVLEGVKKGKSAREIQTELVQSVGMTEKRAKFVARDQTGSILGQMTRERHKRMGVTKFRWQDSRDERVRGNPMGKYPNARPSHWAYSGNVYEYAKPPKDGIPGEAPNCRCVAEPVFE